MNKKFLHIIKFFFLLFIAISCDEKNNVEQHKQVGLQSVSLADNNIDDNKKSDIVEKETNFRRQSIKNFKTDKADTLIEGNVALFVPESSLTYPIKISITFLSDEDIKTLPDNLVNVTADASACRFLPHGEHFHPAASIKIPFDKDLIPQGYSEQDIRSYYYDEITNKWMALELDSIYEDYIVSLSEHFTDIINGIIKLPEHPETQAYTPTTINDIKVADASAGIIAIEAPQANQNASATMSFPLKIQAGRENMHPNLALQYSSDAGSGWIGSGWNISIPSITIDSRWGVPKYDENYETETYILSGEQLSPQAHRDSVFALRSNSNKQFYPRTEQDFKKIIRKGNSPKNYNWEIIDKNGVHYLYAGKSDGNVDENAVIRTIDGNIASWALTEVRSSNGNFVSYEYKKSGNNLYLSSAKYTGYGNEEGKHEIRFISSNSNNRKDKIVTARLGVLQTDAELLSEIQMLYSGQLQHSYSLHYQEGAFAKTLLSSIMENDEDGNSFYTTSFDYYNDIENGLFGEVEQWNSGTDVSGSFITVLKNGFEGNLSMLNGGYSSGFSAGGGLSLGIFPVSVGATVSYSKNTGNGELIWIDIDGDNLPDKVFKKNGQLWYRKMSFGADGQAIFSAALPIQGINDFSKSSSESVNTSVDVSIGIGPVSGGIEYSHSTNTSKSKIYFQDFNGDGLPDIANNGVVYFNHIGQDGLVTFTQNSYETPAPIAGTKYIDNSFQVDYQAERDSMETRYPLHDVIRVWQAPFPGVIRINAPASLSASSDSLSAANSDGVRLMLQKDYDIIWIDSLLSVGENVNIPSDLSINVNINTKLFFRLQSRYQALLDEVNWSPTIVYDTIIDYLKSDNTIDSCDVNGLNLYRYQASEDFVFANAPATFLPKAGTVDITAPYSKKKCSDTVVLQIEKKKLSSSGNEISTIIFSKVLLPNTIEDDIVSFPLTINLTDTISLTFNIITPSNINQNAIEWRPIVKYSTIDGLSASELVEQIDNYTYTIAPSYTEYNKTIYIANAHILRAMDGSYTGKIRALPDIRFYASEYIQNQTAILSLKDGNAFSSSNNIPINPTFGSVSDIDTVILGEDLPDTLYFALYIDGEVVLATKSNLYLFRDSLVITSHDEYVYDTISLYPLDIDTNLIVVYDSNYIVCLTDTVSVSMYSKVVHTEIGHLYRGWGQFAWNGNRERAFLPIDMSKLRYNTDDYDDLDPDNMEEVDIAAFGSISSTEFFPMNFDAKDERYNSMTAGAYLDKNGQSSSRITVQEIIIDSVDYPTDGSRLAAPIKSNKSKTNGVSANVIAISVSSSTGKDESVQDAIDLNGDRYPDWLNKKNDQSNVNYTNPTGSTTETVNTFSVLPTKASSIAETFGIGSVTINSIVAICTSASKTTEGTTAANKSNETASTSVSASGSFASNDDELEYSWLDINGDGLPDLIYNNGTVKLNMGYSFADASQYNFNNIQVTGSTNFGAGLGVSIPIAGRASVGFGANATRTEANTSYRFEDINGDGLPDIVKTELPFGYFDAATQEKTYVAINTGTEFLGFTDISPFCLFNVKSTSMSVYANAAYTITVPIFWGLTLLITPRILGSLSYGVSRTTSQMMDVDGDGHLDIVYSDDEKYAYVRRSKIGRTNMLKSCTNAFGGKINLEYAKAGNTYEMPQCKYVMSKVMLENSLKDNGMDSIVYEYEYEGGYQDRYERDFYGFRNVIQKQYAQQNDQEPYRIIKQSYLNNNYYSKNLLEKEEIFSGNGDTLSSTKNYYNIISLGNERKFPAIVKTEQTIFENLKSITTTNEYQYDSIGNITHFTDRASGNPADRIDAEITYHNIESKNIKSSPKSINISTASGQRRFRETAIDNNGNVLQITQKISDTANAVYNFEYDGYGNLTKVLRPANYNGERLSFYFEYDEQIHKLITKVSDAYGYSSSTQYDYSKALPIETTDINGEKITYTYDNRDRLTSILAPYERQNGKDYTIKFEYFTNTSVPYAKTSHYDSYSDKNIETYAFSDGLMRQIQIKKTGTIWNNNSEENVMLVSGKIIFDNLGRQTQVYQAITEPLAQASIYNPNKDNIAPTINYYDAKDRNIKTILPDGTTAQESEFAIVDKDGEQMLESRISDALGRTSETYTDSRGRNRETVQHTDDYDVVSKFLYDAMGEVQKVIHPNNAQTLYQYDLLGRKTKMQHPDAGAVTMVYDNANNLIKKQTDNLKYGIGENAYIRYSYDKERLTEVLYPKNIFNRVTYSYGNAGEVYGRAGRLTLVEDGSGGEEYFYGAMGEVVKTIKTVILDASEIRTWIWEAEYDSWNRIRKMIYPDAEAVIYDYNDAGEFRSMRSEKEGENYNIVDITGYDKLGQMLYQRLGNGSETHYTYDYTRNRLQNMNLTANDKNLMNNDYQYDLVDNILGIENTSTAALPTGGGYQHNYSYDKLNRLISATGNYNGNENNPAKTYTLQMQYDVMSNPLHKEQVIENDSLHSHNYEYLYEGIKPNAPSQIGNKLYSYDHNGNPILVEDSADFRQMLWDEDNRMAMLSDGGYTSRYTYNHAGERVVKSHGGTQGIFVNGAPMGMLHHDKGNYTVYVSPYFVASDSLRFTKHYYAGSNRISSRTGEGIFQNIYTAGGITAGQKDYYKKMRLIEQGREEYYKQLGIPPGPPTMKGIYGEPESTGDELPNGMLGNYDAPTNWPKTVIFNPQGDVPGPLIQWGDPQIPSIEAGYGFTGNGKSENNQYFYHSDHLGSTSYITDRLGNAEQFIVYMPYGEVLTEEHGSWESPYRFNGKELDAETGLYYYGARYYEPNVAMWYGVDPMAEKYPNVGGYVYCVGNPVRLIDPTGMDVEEITTDYRNTKGELLYHTDDGLNDVIIVSDGDIPTLKQELQTAKDNGTINDPETNKNKMHVLGKTPQQYTEEALNGMDDYWVSGYKETYDKAYTEGMSQFSFSQIFSAIVSAIATENDSNSGEMRHGGRSAGISEGNSDRKNERINRLNPYSSLKNNSPLIILKDKNSQTPINCVLKNKSKLP